MALPSRRSLFGGALLAAGLSVQTAGAQSFVFNYSASYVGLVDVNTHQSIARDYAYGPGFLSVFAGAGNSYASTDLASQTILSRALSRDDGVLAAGFHFFSYFQVTQNVLATVWWDFRADQGYEGSRIAISAPGTGLLLSEEYSAHPAGSTKLLLLAGQTYYLEGAVFAQAGTQAPSFYSIAVPAPGPAVALAVAGIGLSRRRR